MSVKLRRYKDGWEIDIRIRSPDGERLRERRKSPVNSRSAAMRGRTQVRRDDRSRMARCGLSKTAGLRPFVGLEWPRDASQEWPTPAGSAHQSVSTSPSGAPAKAIQELPGHQDLSMTQRYMHLSPAALDAAIRLLDGPQRGAILETQVSANR
jgi:integrase